jgi:hypothetical protein
MPGLESIVQNVTYEWYCNGPYPPPGEPVGHVCINIHNDNDDDIIAEPTTMFIELVLAVLLLFIIAPLLVCRAQPLVSPASKSMSASMVLLAISFFLDAFEHGYGRELKCVGGPNTMQLCQRYSYLWIPILLCFVYGISISLFALSLQAYGEESHKFDAAFGYCFLSVLVYTILVIVGTIVPVEILISPLLATIVAVPPLISNWCILLGVAFDLSPNDQKKDAVAPPVLWMVLIGWSVILLALLVWLVLETTASTATIHAYFSSKDLFLCMFLIGVSIFSTGFYRWAVTKAELKMDRTDRSMRMIMESQMRLEGMTPKPIRNTINVLQLQTTMDQANTTSTSASPSPSASASSPNSALKNSPYHKKKFLSPPLDM